MKQEEERVLMNVTKSEAKFILYDRLENHWYVELEPLFIFGPGCLIAYLVYELVLRYSSSTWIGLLAICPIVVIAFLLLIRQFKKRHNKAEQLYQQMQPGAPEVKE